MKITRAAAKKTVVAAVVILTVGILSGSLATADQVDDLLAGKPVKIEDVASETDSSASVDDRIVVPVEDKTLADESWEVAHAEPSHTSLNEAASPRPLQPIGAVPNISVVPEPSAIALAALALVYFLLFFRRRYSF